MICKQCGARIDDNAKECEFCGAVYSQAEPEIEEVIPAEELAEEVEEVTNEVVDEERDEIDEMLDENEVKRQEQIERVRQEKQSRLDEIEKRRTDKRKKQRRMKALIIVLSVICLAAIGYGAYYLTSSGGEDPDVVIVTPRPQSTIAPIATATPEASEMPVVSAEPSASQSPEIIPLDPEDVSPTAKPTAKPVATKKPVVTKKPAATKKPVVNNASDYNSVKAKYNGGYVFANSSTTALTAADMAGKSATELRVARNEIYARKGRGFSNKSLQAYFNSCSWYKQSSSYDYNGEYSRLSSVEKANINLIKQYEAKAK